MGMFGYIYLNGITNPINWLFCLLYSNLDTFFYRMEQGVK